MISEEMLRTAAAELSTCQVLSLVEPEEEHTFSDGFEKKIKRLTQRVNYPLRRLFINVAAVFVAVVLAAGVLLFLSPEVRAIVTKKWVLSYSDSAIGCYHNGGAVRQMTEYILGEIPEGFTLYKATKDHNGISYIYYGPDGKLLSFICVDGSQKTQMHFASPNMKHSQTEIEGMKADIFISADSEENNTIIWVDQDTHLLYAIYYRGNQEDLIRLAQSVTVKK